MRLRRKLFRAYYCIGLPEPTDLISNQTNGERLSLLLVGKARKPSNDKPMNKEKHTPTEDFHLGKLIKAELARQGRTATWLAKQVHCTPENIYKTCCQKWVTMPLLFEISKALDCDFFRACSEYLETEKTN